MIKKIPLWFNIIKNRLIINYLKKRYKNKQTIKQTKINNCKILVFVNNGIGRSIYGLKKYEKENTDFIKKIIKNNWVCFDIGANIGYYSLLLAKLAKDGYIHCFEPNKLDFKLLNRNIEINNFNNIRTNSLALSNQNNLIDFYLAQDSGFSSFKDTKRQQIKKIEKAKTITFDSYIAENNIEKIDFIKIDVEGAEKLVLEGAKETLQTIKPKLMLIEICEKNLKAFNENGWAIINLLKESGYLPYAISKNKLEKFRQNNFTKSQDIYFIHQNF